jgi:hypothetical protein
MPWLGLSAAFSPVLAGMAKTFWEIPPSRPALLAPVLLVLALTRIPMDPAPARRDGLLGLVLGLLLALFGVAAETEFIARIGLPVAALGLARYLGRPNPRTLALLLFALPLPGTLLMMASPGLERTLGKLTLLVTEGLGAPLELVGRTLVGTAGRIELDPPVNGLALVPMLAGLGWYASIRVGADLWTGVKRVLAFAALALPLQLAGLVVAAGLLWGGSSDSGKLWLSHGLWLTIAVSGLVWVERRTASPAAARWAEE